MRDTVLMVAAGATMGLEEFTACACVFMNERETPAGTKVAVL